MNVEIGAEAALFPEKEDVSGIFVAVCVPTAHFLSPIIYILKQNFLAENTIFKIVSKLFNNFNLYRDVVVEDRG